MPWLQPLSQRAEFEMTEMGSEILLRVGRA
jgi:hypothetical protein